MEPDVDAGLVTWLDVEIEVYDDAIEVGRNTLEVGRARIALIHGGEALNRDEPIEDVLDADSQELHDLHEVFFDGEGLKEVYENGNGNDVFYVSEIEIAEAWRGKNIEAAVVRRLVDVWAGGAAIAVVPVADLMEAQRWATAGFALMALAPTAHSCGYVAMDLTMRHPSVIEEENHVFRFEPVRLPTDEE